MKGLKGVNVTANEVTADLPIGVILHYFIQHWSHFFKYPKLFCAYFQINELSLSKKASIHQQVGILAPPSF